MNVPNWQGFIPEHDEGLLGAVRELLSVKDGVSTIEGLTRGEAVHLLSEPCTC